MYRAQTVSVSIGVDPDSTYDFASDPQNLPQWAPGFVQSVERRGDHWIAKTTLGDATFRFAPPNSLGVLDHDVELPGGRFHNPMRVIPNGSGSEVLFTLLQLQGVTDEQFSTDIQTVLADLLQLKQVLELRHPDPPGCIPMEGSRRMALPPVRKIGDTLIQPKHRASCHCGGVVLELDLPQGVVNARRCTCSMCRRKGAVMGAVPIEGLRVVQGEELLTLYRFNTMTAEHYFCSRCGIYTHHRRRSNPNQYGYNLGCLDGVDPNQVQGVPVNDGVNHPADRSTDPAAG